MFQLLHDFSRYPASPQPQAHELHELRRHADPTALSEVGCEMP
jgi:hypothetical protein